MNLILWAGVINLLHAAVYDPSGRLSDKISRYRIWNELKDVTFVGTQTICRLEEAVINHTVDVILADGEQSSSFAQTDFIQKVLSNYPEIFVVMISSSDNYRDVREAFLMGAYDYLVCDETLEASLRETLMRMSVSRKDVYFNSKIYDKVLLLARHIFDGGSDVDILVKDIVDTIYSDWHDNTIACQQVVERVKQESYKHFVRKKPWLEKFIYRGDYIRDIGFELKERSEIERELCRYYSDVNILFKKYNVIDVNKTIYTIGKSVIRQVDEKVTLESVAGDVYLNKTYISHIFKEMTGVSFNDFVLDVKVDRAKTLLHYPDMSVSAIADILCFGSAGYFSSLFKKHTGVTPTEYKRNIKK